MNSLKQYILEQIIKEDDKQDEEEKTTRRGQIKFTIWEEPDKNNGVGCHFPLQGIFYTQGSNISLLHLLH